MCAQASADRGPRDLFSELSTFLFPGKGQRICDLQAYFPKYSGAQIEAALQDAVADGRVDKSGQGAQAMYFQTRATKN